MERYMNLYFFRVKSNFLEVMKIKTNIIELLS